ncbi:hypothetical protein F3Y22_tig00112206pilonHSYRG00268 [Hibiscus syriacus]|uniref:Uncharacterized protein n=1 Tax=Hibiscus syriacus TaxID=106335 RepID=A0A6A2X5F6_HIBSY|nr:uncharacterized protein LOC120175528 [Hibiscus syriacus]KAE8670108.1 hypothetical protein F3Y22_tig00112206pilonHSYRG00268 [Hibiscus syriacus]
MAVAKLLLVSFVLVLIHVAVAEVDVEPREIKVHDQDHRPGWEIPREAEKPAAIEIREAEAPEIRRLGKHHASGISVAGGGVIIGGLVTAVFLAVFAYIRVTRKNDGVQVQQH